MKTLYTRFTLLITILILTLTSACAAVPPVAPPDGQVLSMHVGTTLWGLKQALMQSPGTFIMAKDGAYMFAWSANDGWAFIVLDSTLKTSVNIAKNIQCGANLVNCKTMYDFMESIKSMGWVQKAPSDVPAVIYSAAQALGNWVYLKAANFYTFYVMPANAPSDFLKQLGIEGDSGT